MESLRELKIIGDTRMFKVIMSNMFHARRLAMAVIFTSVLTGISVYNASAQTVVIPREAKFMSVPVGIAPGQTVRVSVVNPVFVDGSVRSVRGGHVKIFDGVGNVHLEIPFGPIVPGAFHQVDIDRSHLNTTGDPNTGVQRTRIEVTLSFNASTSTPMNEVFPPSFELVNEQGGQTILIGMLLPAIQKVR